MSDESMNENAAGAEKTQEDGSRAQGGSGWPEPDRERVSVSKEGSDVEMVTRVIHPPRKLRKSGELRDALLSGIIDLDEFRKGCEDGMSAVKAIPCKNGTVIYEPDWQTRLAFRKFVVETVEGMPVKRQEIISKKLTTEDDLIRMARKSPALRKSLLHQLQKLQAIEDRKAKAEAAGEQKAKAEVSNKGGAET